MTSQPSKSSSVTNFFSDDATTRSESQAPRKHSAASTKHQALNGGEETQDILCTTLRFIFLNLFESLRFDLMSFIVKVALACVVLAVALYYNGGKELMFVLSGADNGNAPFPPEMRNCPKV